MNHLHFLLGEVDMKGLQLKVLLFVRSIRSRDFKIYKQVIRNLLPWFFALDHVHYARWLSVHLCDMLKLNETSPDVSTYFERGMFVVSKTKRSSSSIGIDHAHEQNNKCVKGDGGKQHVVTHICLKCL